MDGALIYLENTGTSTAPVFVQRTGDANPLDGISVGYRSKPAFADIDGDGDPDLIVAGYDGVLDYLENNGTSTAPEFMARPGSNPFDGIDVGPSSAPALADIDGDGDLDLVVGASSGLLSYFANGYCAMLCGGRGVCDGTANMLPTCDCLTGFTGHQCDECQTGYFGSTCDLCPEGGNETKAAPRIADTCGVAGSGRSRGKCDDGFAGSGNCTCFEGHFTGAGCSGGVCPAGTVESIEQNGLFYEALCKPCPPGTHRGPLDDPETCINCQPNEYSAGAADACTSCAPGYFSAAGAGECEPCDAGRYRGDGDDQCIKCPFPSTTVSAGATGCYKCSAGSYFSPFAEGPVRCDDPVELEAQCRDDDTKCFDKCCASCEKGMNCANLTSNTLQDVAIEDGWWRDSSFSHKVYKCENSDSCKGGLCTEGHEGVACRVCEAGYHYSSVESKCLECGSFRAHPLAIVSGLCLFLLLVASIYIFRRQRPELFEKAVRAAEEKVRGMATDAGSGDVDVLSESNEAVKRLAQDNAMALATDGIGGLAAVGEGASSVLSKAPAETSELLAGAATSAAAKLTKQDDDDDANESSTKDDAEANEEDAEETEEERREKFIQSAQTKLKILLAVYQIQNALPWALPYVSYPDAFETLVAWMSFIELDFVRIVPLSCMMPYSFFDKLFASTILPLILAAIILVLGRIASWRRSDPAEQRATWTYAYSWFLLLTYVVFTGVSTTVLRFFNCVRYETVDAAGALVEFEVLQADHSISCNSPSYKVWTGYAWVMVFVYPIGIPLLYFAELWYHRKAINPDVAAGYAVINPDVSAGAPPAADAPPDGDAPPAGLTIMTEKDVQELKIKRRSEDKSIQHLEFLFRDYEPRTYLFIVFECVRRLALTGMLIFIFPGSASQIVVGLFVAVFSQLIIAAAGPWPSVQNQISRCFSTRRLIDG